MITKRQQRIFKERLFLLRRSCKKTQAEVAKSLYISRSCYANYENGQRTPNYEFVFKIADFFDVTPEFLLGKEVHNQDLDNYMKEKVRLSHYLNKHGCLDLSELSSIKKINLIEYFNYLLKTEEQPWIM